MQTSKSPRMVAVVALRIGERSLPRYAHRFAPHTFTQPQLFACLVLKCFFRTDYRGIVAILHDAPLLRQTLGLSRVPHFTTLQKAAQRLLHFSRVRLLLTASFQLLMARRSRVRCAAADSTG
ncbi:MAG: transposase, partial [Phycisphaerales bacterium]|nr:transposase [Phycisphaerales bacterium]